MEEEIGFGREEEQGDGNQEKRRTRYLDNNSVFAYSLKYSLDTQILWLYRPIKHYMAHSKIEIQIFTCLDCFSRSSFFF